MFQKEMIEGVEQSETALRSIEEITWQVARGRVMKAWENVRNIAAKKVMI